MFNDFDLTNLMFDDKPLEHPLSVFVQHVRTQVGETFNHQVLGGGLLLLQLQKHRELHHLRLQLTQRGQTVRDASLQTRQGTVVRLSLRDYEWSRVDCRGCS